MPLSRLDVIFVVVDDVFFSFFLKNQYHKAEHDLADDNTTYRTGKKYMHVYACGLAAKGSGVEVIHKSDGDGQTER